MSHTGSPVSTDPRCPARVARGSRARTSLPQAPLRDRGPCSIWSRGFASRKCRRNRSCWRRASVENP
ncbi:hypothetical protein GmHk_05G012481 [Glycine max]|nr:hypothetical protein GmHk_05G012481 [Glycine max]